MPVLPTIRDHLATARRYASRPHDRPLAPRFNPVRRWYHGGSSGAFLVVAGELTEHTVATRPGHPARLAGATLPTGQGRAFGPRHIHQITDHGHRPACRQRRGAGRGGLVNPPDLTAGVRRPGSAM